MQSVALPVRRIALVAAACLLNACLASADELVSRTLTVGVMGTELNIETWGETPERLDGAMAAAVLEMRRIEDLMTEWRPSPLTRLNDSAGQGAHVVPRELAEIIARGHALHELSSGAFDISFLAVGRLWDFKKSPPVIPSAQDIEAALPFVDASRIRVNEADLSVTLPEKMEIGLGGLAKGYGVDRAMQVLMDHGVKHAIVNAGGDLKALGRKQNALWEVALKHPRDRDRAMAVIKLSNSCLVTSGDYERFFEADGKRYHHIIDPRTGYPSTGCMSASIVARNAEYADALATACCVLSVEKGLALIESLDHVEGVLVDLKGAVHVSPGLKHTLVQEP
ncbi:MAG: thiamine biosynthesis lipoprotein [Kiritimatiellia bacterium]|jgi:FAD:protein FMN transferase